MLHQIFMPGYRTNLIKPLASRRLKKGNGKPVVDDVAWYEGLLELEATVHKRYTDDGKNVDAYLAAMGRLRTRLCRGKPESCKPIRVLHEAFNAKDDDKDVEIGNFVDKYTAPVRQRTTATSATKKPKSAGRDEPATDSGDSDDDDEAVQLVDTPAPTAATKKRPADDAVTSTTLQPANKHRDRLIQSQTQIGRAHV